MDYMTVKQAAKKWNISDRRVRALCAEGRIDGAVYKDRAYSIPADALKPIDGRTTRNKEIPAKYASLFASVDELKDELSRRRPLTKGELQRLQDEFLVEFTYNSNAIEGSTLTMRETALVLEGVTIDRKPLKDHLDAVGHRDAFLYACSLVSERTPISERIIKELHSLVLVTRPEDRGVYRRIPVNIMRAFHEPPQPYLVPVQMEKLVRDLAADRRHVLESSATFH
jgi:Fic family protein